jgi:putative membrane protein
MALSPEILTVISLALVFGAVLGAIPTAILPRAPGWVYDAIPHLNAAISFVAILTIVQGWRWIRQGQILKHRTAMLTALTLFAVFFFYSVFNTCYKFFQ